MATLQNRAIFEFCEKTYSELEKQDNGYYPQKHDKIVLEKAANHFSTSEQNVAQIYDSYTKLSAKIEMMKINRLPKKKRMAAIKGKAKDILLNNKDLPFHITEGSPSTPLKPATEIIEEEFNDTIIKLAQAGWTIPLTIDIENLYDLKNCSSNQENIDEYFTKFYTTNELEHLYEIIINSIDNPGQKKRFEECYNIFKQGLYSTCLTTLITILEGMIAAHGDDPKDVRVMRVCNYHISTEKKNGNLIMSMCWQSVYEYTKLLFEKSDFSQAEPDGTKRHWLVHGRTSQIGEKLDCIRLFNALSTISNLNQQ